MLSSVLLTVGILSAGVVYGVDIFFAVVGRPALAASSNAAISEVMGHIHKSADARMPIFGGLGILSTFVLTVTTPVGTTISWLAVTALAGLLVQLGLYLVVSKPVNHKMTEAVRLGKVPEDIRQMQDQWDSVIVGRSLAMTIVILCLTSASLLT